MEAQFASRRNTLCRPQAARPPQGVIRGANAPPRPEKSGRGRKNGIPDGPPCGGRRARGRNWRAIQAVAGFPGAMGSGEPSGPRKFKARKGLPGSPRARAQKKINGGSAVISRAPRQRRGGLTKSKTAAPPRGLKAPARHELSRRGARRRRERLAFFKRPRPRPQARKPVFPNHGSPRNSHFGAQGREFAVRGRAPARGPAKLFAFLNQSPGAPWGRALVLPGRLWGARFRFAPGPKEDRN
jgi:hypothetical protein